MALRLRESLHEVTGSEPVTASFGVSGRLGRDDAPEAILRRGDEALSVATLAGRDRAAQWESPSTEAQAGLHWISRRPRHPRVGVPA